MEATDSTITPLVTLVVPVRNEAARLDACLASLTAQTYPRDRLEILVVDGESTDDTVARASEWAARDPRIRLLRNAEHLMPAGLNLGIGQASGSIVGVISGHSQVEPEYVERSVDALNSTRAWSVGGRIRREGDTPMQAAIAAATASPLGVGDSRHNYATEAGWVDTVFPGMWPREVFDRIGLFDTAMVANEDNELSHRIRLAGGRIWYDPAIVVTYHPRATLSGLFDQYRRYGLGKVLVFRKHRGGLSWRHAVPALWLAWLVGGPVVAVGWRPALWVWGTGVGLYAVAIAAGAVSLQRPSVPSWRIALALVTLHLAYGIGTWQGIFRALVGR